MTKGPRSVLHGAFRLFPTAQANLGVLTIIQRSHQLLGTIQTGNSIGGEATLPPSLFTVIASNSSLTSVFIPAFKALIGTVTCTSDQPLGLSCSNFMTGSLFIHSAPAIFGSFASNVGSIVGSLQEVFRSFKGTISGQQVAKASFTGPAVTPVYVQSASVKADPSAASISVAFSSNVGTGQRLIIVTQNWVGTSSDTTTAPTDTLGSTYTAVKYLAAGGGAPTQAKVWYGIAPTGGGANTVQANWSSAQTFRGLMITEVSGAATSSPLDQTNAQLSTGASLSSQTVTTTQDNELIYGAVVDYNTNSGGFTAGTNESFTKRQDQGYFCNETAPKTTAGSTSAQFNASLNTADNFLVFVATFKASGGTTPSGLAFVQKAIFNGSSTTSTTFAVTLGSSVKAGNLLAVSMLWATGAESDFVSIADNLGNTYTLVDHTVANGDPARTYYAKNILGGSCTITVTLNTARGFETIMVHEISGCSTTSPLDQHVLNSQSGPSTATDAVTTTNVTTTHDGEYIYGSVFLHNNFADTYTAGTGYTRENLAVGDATHGAAADEFKIQTTAGAIAATFTRTASTGDTTTFLMAFNA